MQQTLTMIKPDSMSAGNAGWYTGQDIEYFPRSLGHFSPLDQFAPRYVFHGFGPESPILKDTDKVITMGSCFADRLRNWLKANGRNADYLNVPEGLNNSFAVRQYLEWALTGERSDDAYWYTEPGQTWEPEQEQKEVLEHFKNTKAVVITFGLAEVWKDVDTGGVFWRGVPDDVYDPEKHSIQRTTVQQNVDNFNRICYLIKKYAGEDTVIVFTLSPVPLNATFTGQPTMVADCASKSILRAALNEFFFCDTANTYYWPSFEMVRWVGAHVPLATLWEDNTPRHVNNEIVGIIIDNFVKKFFKQS